MNPKRPEVSRIYLYPCIGYSIFGALRLINPTPRSNGLRPDRPNVFTTHGPKVDGP